MFPNSTIPSTMPDISMHYLTEEELDDLRDVSLADAIKEARRRIKVKFDEKREATNKMYDEQLAAIRSAPAPVTADATSPSEKSIAPPPEAPCDSPTRKLESVLVEERNLRRRLNNDTPDTDIGNSADKQFNGPQFFGKTPVKDIAALIPSDNLSTHMSRIYIDQVKAPKDNIPEPDRLDDPNNLDLLARFLYQVHEYLSGGLHWSSYQEKWILKQLVPNSTAAEAFKLKWDATKSDSYTVNCTSCRFEDLSQFREALLRALYGNSNIYQLVSDYIKKLSISHRENKAPKTCMELVLRAERVYNLLGAPHNVATVDQIAVIIQQLPPATSSAIKIAALTNPALTSKYDELKKYVTLIDEQFKTDLLNRKKKYVPNRYNRQDTNRHQHPHTQTKSAGAQQQHNNSISHSNNNFKKSGDKIPAKPFAGSCDHCGAKGHRIRDCRKASEAQKAEWLKKFNERRAAKRKQPEDNKS